MPRGFADLNAPEKQAHQLPAFFSVADREHVAHGAQGVEQGVDDLLSARGCRHAGDRFGELALEASSLAFEVDERCPNTREIFRSRGQGADQVSAVTPY